MVSVLLAGEFGREGWMDGWVGCIMYVCRHGSGSVRTWEPERRRREALPAHGWWWAALRCEHGVCACLAFGGVGGCDGVDDGLGFFVADFCAVEWFSLRSCYGVWERGREGRGGKRREGERVWQQVYIRW